MVHNMGVNDVLKDFTSYGGKGNRTVIGCVGGISFFEYWADICTQPGCISPVSKDFWKIIDKAGAISSAATLRIRAGIPSGPVALCGLRSESNLVMPETETVMLGMGGIEVH